MMTIYTRFGTPVKLLGSIDEMGFVNVLRDGLDKRKYHVAELKADNGWNEISASVEALEKSEAIRRDYKQAYRALRRWNKAAWRGYSPRDTISMFRNIRDAYPRPIFDAALVSLMESNAYLIYHIEVKS